MVVVVVVEKQIMYARKKFAFRKQPITKSRQTRDSLRACDSAAVLNHIYLQTTMPVATPSPLKLNGSTAPWRPVRVKDLHRTEFSFDSIEGALEAFAAGEAVVVMDDESRENEGDIIISASQCTAEKMAWIIKHTRSVDDAFQSIG